METTTTTTTTTTAEIDSNTTSSAVESNTTTNNTTNTPPTITTTTTTDNNKNTFVIPKNNIELTSFLKPIIHDKQSVDYRNLVFKLGSLDRRVLSNDVHIPTIVQLHSINVCPRCIFRFINNRDFSVYQETYETLSHFIQHVCFNQKQKDLKKSSDEEASTKDEPTTTTTTDATTTTEPNKTTTTTTEEIKQYDPNLNFELKNFVCCCCLGILQETNNGELFLEEFLVKMKSSGYEFSNYSLALTVPVSASIRDQSVWYYLVDCFPSVYKSKENSMDIPEVKEGLKWILGPIIGSRLLYHFKPNSDFRANMKITHEETKEDHQFLTTLEANNRGAKRQKPSTKRIKTPSNDSTSTISDLLLRCSKKDFILHGTVPPTTPITKYQYQLDFKHEPVFLAGKYNKFVRDLSQTPWEYNDSSVQDIICKDINQLFKSDSFVFTTSGREDIDVRMLGAGRPFYIEITNPHRIFFKNQDYETLENSINNSTKKIKVSNLQLITKKETNTIKDSGGTKQKNYRCVVWTSRVLQPSDLDLLNTMSNIEIKQNTPIRVLHRRTLMVRNKKISKLVATFISPHFFTLDIIDAQAGTYIKEFVHGDLGRTSPNIGSLLGGCEADILQLDVLNVDLDFPKVRK